MSLRYGIRRLCPITLQLSIRCFGKAIVDFANSIRNTRDSFLTYYIVNSIYYYRSQSEQPFDVELQAIQRSRLVEKYWVNWLCMFIMGRYKICDRCVIWIVSVIWGTTPLMLWEMWCKEFMLCTFLANVITATKIQKVKCNRSWA